MLLGLGWAGKLLDLAGDDREVRHRWNHQRQVLAGQALTAPQRFQGALTATGPQKLLRQLQLFRQAQERLRPDDNPALQVGQDEP
jgi:hypothetical protein